jgi:hypothetical protein
MGRQCLPAGAEVGGAARRFSKPLFANGYLATRDGPGGAVRIQRIPGSSPFIPRSIFCIPPFATIFIIFCACSN